MTDDARAERRSLFDRVRVFSKGKLADSRWYNMLLDKYLRGTSSCIRFDPLRIVMVDPADIEYISGSITSGNPDSYHLEYIDRPVPFGRRSIGAVVDGEWDRTGYEFDELSEYKSFEAHYERGMPWEETELYRAHLKNIQDGYSSYGARSVEGLNQRFDEIDRLFESVSKNGVISHHEIGKGLLSEIGIAIGRDGHPLFFGEGRHRLCIAKLLDLNAVPALVHVRHKDLMLGECKRK